MNIKLPCLLVLLVPCLLVGVGCSSSEEPTAKVTESGDAKAASGPQSAAPSAAAAGEKSTAKSKTSSAKQSDPPPGNGDSPTGVDLADVGELFALPKEIVPEVQPEPEPEPEPKPELVVQPAVVETKKPKQLPPLRLVGFTEVDRLKALLRVDGQLNVVAVGDAPEGINVVAITPPVITLRNGDDGEEFQIDLYEQSWHHPMGAATGDRRSLSDSASPSKNSSGEFRPGAGPSIPPPHIAPAIRPEPAVPGSAPAAGFGGMLGPPGTLGADVTGLPGAPPAPAVPPPVPTGRAGNNAK